MTNPIWITSFGSVPYARATALQQCLWQARCDEANSDTLLLLSHPPTISLGRRATAADILAEPAAVCRAGITLHKSDRGGAATYHGPGQVVGYCIFKLEQFGPEHFVHGLEETLIGAVSEFAVAAERCAGDTGVCVEGRKLAALGLALQRRVTRHGFALNIAPNLTHSQYIVPCRLPSSSKKLHPEVTPLERECGGAIGEAAVQAAILEMVTSVFGTPVECVSYAELSSIVRGIPRLDEI